MLKRLKVITSYTGHARFLDETDEGLAGEVLSTECPTTPYRYSQTTDVYRWKGRMVVVCEVSHKRYEVLEVPASLIQPHGTLDRSYGFVSLANQEG